MYSALLDATHAIKVPTSEFAPGKSFMNPCRFIKTVNANQNFRVANETYPAFAHPPRPPIAAVGWSHRHIITNWKSNQLLSAPGDWLVSDRI